MTTTEDNEARDKGAAAAIRAGLARLLDASQAGAARIILDALAAEGDERDAARAELEALRVKANALADEWERLTEVYASARVIGEIHYRDAARRLRALIVQEDTEKEDQR